MLHVASECAPFAKTGGLGDVVGALPIAQRELGIDARVVLPLYSGIDWNAQERLPQTLVVPMGTHGHAEFAGLRRGHLPNSSAPIYFVEHHGYFDRGRGNIYGDGNGEFRDNLARFTFLSRAAFAIARAENFVPDIIHAHDWQTALVPAYVDTLEWGTPFHGAATVLSIHNLGYQGLFASGSFPTTGLGWEHFHEGEFAHRGGGAINLLQGGLAHADRIVAVSPTYAEEIMGERHGAGLDGFLRQHSRKVSGILNGIDADVWNPATDRHLPAHFDAHNLAGKAHCKAELQRELGLPVRPDTPMFGVVSRFTSQKGLDYLVSILPRLLDWDIQLVVVGTGDKSLEHAFRIAAHARPDKMASILTFSDPLAHRVEAAADFFLMPSRYEPCGMNQMYSLRYGTVPVVHAVGGLDDTIRTHRPNARHANGFKFTNGSGAAVVAALRQALRVYRDPLQWRGLMSEGMSDDHSWDRAAREYVKVYKRARRDARDR